MLVFTSITDTLSRKFNKSLGHHIGKVFHFWSIFVQLCFYLCIDSHLRQATCLGGLPWSFQAQTAFTSSWESWTLCHRRVGIIRLGIFQPAEEVTWYCCLAKLLSFFQSFTASYRSYGNGTIAVLKGKRSNSADDRCNSESLFTLLMKFRCNEIGLCNAAWHFCLVTDVVRLLVGRNAPKMNQGFTPAHWVICDMEAISH